jgi:hypothetical protein
MPKGEFLKGIVVSANPKGWMTEEILVHSFKKFGRKEKDNFTNLSHCLYSTQLNLTKQKK